MTEHEMQAALNDLFAELILSTDCDEYPENLPDELREVDMVQTYEEAGLLTTDAGIVIRMRGGAEYQITIRCSR
jgi:hypothetical protein